MRTPKTIERPFNPPSGEQSLAIARKARSLKALKVIGVQNNYGPTWAPDTWTALLVSRKSAPKRPSRLAQLAKAAVEAPKLSRVTAFLAHSVELTPMALADMVSCLMAELDVGSELTVRVEEDGGHTLSLTHPPEVSFI